MTDLIQRIEAAKEPPSRLAKLYQKKVSLEQMLDDAQTECEAGPILHSLRLNQLCIAAALKENPNAG